MVATSAQVVADAGAYRYLIRMSASSHSTTFPGLHPNPSPLSFHADGRRKEIKIVVVVVVEMKSPGVLSGFPIAGKTADHPAVHWPPKKPPAVKNSHLALRSNDAPLFTLFPDILLRLLGARKRSLQRRKPATS